MADEKRNVTIVLNGKEVQNSIQAITKSWHKQRIAVAKMTRGTKEYEAGVRELKKTKQILDSHNKSLRGGAGAWRRIKETALGFVGGSLITAGLGILKQGITSLIQGITALDESLGKLQSITGVSDQQLAQLKDQAFITGNQLGKTAKDIVDAYTIVGSEMPALLQNTAALDSMTQKAIILSQATKQELQPTIADLTSIMNANGAASNEATRFINTLAAGSQKGAKPVSFLADAMRNLGPTAKSANVQIEQQVGILEVLGEKGVVASKAGTGLRNVLLTLQQDSANFTDGQFDMNKAMGNLTPIMNDSVELTNKFGKENVVVAQILAQNKGKIDELTAAVTGTNTAYDQAEINMDTLSGKMDIVASKWDNLKLSVADGDGVFSDWGKTATGWLDDLIGGLQLAQDGLIEFSPLDFLDPRTFKENLDNVRAHADAIVSAKKNADSLSQIGIEALEAEQLILEDLISMADDEGFVKITNSAGESIHKVSTLKGQLLAINEAIGEIQPIDISTKGGGSGDAAKEELRTIKSVRAEVAELQKAREEIASTDFKGLETNARKIELLQEELALAESSGIVRVEMEQIKSTTNTLLEQTQSFEDQKTAMLQTGATTRAAIEEKINQESTDEQIQYRSQQEEQFRQNIFNGLQQAANAIVAMQVSTDDAEKAEKLHNLEELKSKEKITEKEFQDSKRAIEKEAFEKKKKTDIAAAHINAAVAITQIFSQMGIWGFIAAIPVTIATLKQISNIKAQKFKDGGQINGPSHGDGGMPVINPRTGQVEAEVEGGEFIIRKSSVTPATLPILNAVNEGNIRHVNFQKFAEGGMMGGGSTSQQFDPMLQAINAQTRAMESRIDNIKVTLPLKDLDSQQTRRDKIKKIADVA